MAANMRIVVSIVTKSQVHRVKILNWKILHGVWLNFCQKKQDLESVLSFEVNATDTLCFVDKNLTKH